MKSVGANQQGKLVKHFSCESHKAALSDFARFAVESCHIDVQLSRHLKDRLILEKADEVKNQEIMTILFYVARTLSRQNRCLLEVLVTMKMAIFFSWST